MKTSKAIMFWVSFTANFLLKFGIFLYLGLALCVIGIRVRMCLAFGLAFITFDLIASIIESIKRVNNSKEELKNLTKLIESAEDSNPDELTVEELYLKTRLDDDSTVEDCVRVFREMCEMPIEEDMLLFECFKQNLGEEKYIFSIVRQYPNGDGEYCQLRVLMEFELDDSDNTWGLNESVWNDRVPDFWKYIEKSKAYKFASEHKAKRVLITLEET